MRYILPLILLFILSQAVLATMVSGQFIVTQDHNCGWIYDFERQQAEKEGWKMGKFFYNLHGNTSEALCANYTYVGRVTRRLEIKDFNEVPPWEEDENFGFEKGFSTWEIIVRFLKSILLLH